MVRAADPAPTDPDRWEYGDRAERRALFAADPVRGRALLARTWAAEDGEDREWFLDRIGTDPIPADEPLLEAALDDRRKGVRERAVAALGLLPDSAYAARMAARARAAVSVERRPVRSRLVVTPPPDHDAAMARDGIRPTPPANVGPQAWWLRQILAATPLRVWDGLGRPADLLGRTGRDWRDVLTAGWHEATIRQRDPAWAAALLDRGAAERDLAGLVGALTPAERAPAVIRLLGATTPPAPWLLPALLGTCPDPWPDRLAAAVLAAVTRPDVRPRDAREVLTLLGGRLRPGPSSALRDRADQLHDTDWEPALAAVADTLAFRHAMLEELR